MSTDLISYEEAEEIVHGWGYEGFTALQDRVFRHCGLGRNAREFIIGSTSSGKTLIPLVCYKADKRRQERKEKLLYLVPYRALATQKEQEFSEKFPEERVIISTSEYCSEDMNVMNGNCDLAIVIYEKVFLFLSNQKNFLKQYTYIVFDELGIVENPERGLKADYILYMACRYTDHNVYVLATPYFNWENYIRAYSFHEHQEISRPVEIHNTVISYELGSPGHECEEQEQIIWRLCKEHREAGHKILIFANSRFRVCDLARKLYRYFFNDQKTERSFSDSKERFLSRLVMADDDLYGIMDQEDYLAYETGIAWHNASLPEEIRELIERDFLSDDGGIDIVVSTETLAYGLNSNVDVVVVTDMEKPAGGGERKFLTVNEYQNYIGRAGRLGKKKIGYAYTLLNSSQQPAWEALKEKTKNPDRMESQYKYLWEREECIFHLLNYFDCPEGVQKEEVLRKLRAFPYIQGDERVDMDQSVEEMRKRKLIQETVNELDEIKGLKVSRIGTRALGFIIRIDTYDRLLEASKYLFEHGKLYLFDFLYDICQCQELQFKDFYTPHEARNYRSRLMGWLKELEQKGQIFPDCRERIANDPLIGKFKYENGRFGYREFAAIRKVRMAEALYRWIDCGSIKEIKKTCNLDYGTVKKLGEKAKYITDILSADLSMLKSAGSLEIELKRTGLALYYGIKRELIEKLGVLELDPMQGRQLRTIGRVRYVREHFSKAKTYQLESLQRQIQPFPEEYKRLAEGNLDD